MTIENQPPEKHPWQRPQLIRYRLPESAIAFYQTATGALNSIQCTNPDLCTGGEGAALPAWLLPE